MSIDDDDLEQRLRNALTTPRSSDRLDADDFLSSVHRGAKVRRVRRGVSVAAAAALVVAGGGFAINATGVLDGSQTPIASNTSGHGLTTTPTKPGASKSSTFQQTLVGPVKIKPHSFIAANDVLPVSLTATGTAYQWVLAKTPGRDCGRAACATVFATNDHGKAGHWSDVGQLPAPVATSDSPTPVSVSQLRFSSREDGTGIHDGWAYGNSLWSTHDDGQTWSNADAPAGQVTQLEAWGGFVYAVVADPDRPGSSTLYRSPTTSDDWQPVDLGISLTSVLALAAAKDVVGLIDTEGAHSKLYISHDGQSWESAAACPAGTDPESLSTASDTVRQSLWVACTNAQTTVIQYMDTDAWGQWNAALGTFGGGVMVAASSPSNAVVAGAGVPGIEQVSSTAAPKRVYFGAVGPPVYFGFTNNSYGYLLDSNGKILSTTNGGGRWLPYAVTDTTP